MIADQNKGIDKIDYNHLNLPTAIYFDGENKILYLYDATGKKVKKTVETIEDQIPTHYLDGFQYKEDELQFFSTAEGYVNISHTKYENGIFEHEVETKENQYSYVYNYVDHLGNIRLSYGKDPSNGVLRIIEENHYYPFGLKHTNYNSDKMIYVKENEMLKIKLSPNNIKTSYNYKYNGKELQEELGLNMYDYGSRLYDPARAGWSNIDPKSEQMLGWSPYNYCYDNPMRFIDPDGMKPNDWYLNLKTGNSEWYDGTAQKAGYQNLSSGTNRKESITGGTADGKYSTSLNPNGSFSINGKEHKKGSSATYGTDNNFKITSNLNLKEKALKFTSDIVAPIVETPQDILFPIINQTNVVIQEGAHEGSANNKDNVLLPNTYELNSWNLEPGRSNQSTGNPTFQEGQELINNTLSLLMLPVKVVDNVITNFLIKTAIKKGVKEGMKEGE